MGEKNDIPLIEGYENLPSELLLKIFERLDGKDILSCRKVCRNWKDVIDLYWNDADYWRHMCQRDYPDVYEECFRRAKISWIELYNSLTIWSKISTAEIRVHTIRMPSTKYYCFMENCVISCAHRVHKDTPFRRHDSIRYYDIETYKVKPGGRDFSNNFDHYYEDDVLVAMDFYNVKRQLRLLRVIAKNMPIPDSGEVPEKFSDYQMHGRNWHVFDNSLYYQETKFREGRTINIIRVHIGTMQNGEYFFDPKVIFVGREGEILDVVKYGQHVNVLRSVHENNEDFRGRLVVIVGNLVDYHRLREDHTDMLDALRAFGFHWTFSRTHKWLTEHGYNDDPRLKHHDVHAPLTYDKYVITATRDHPVLIHIFYNPYVGIQLVLEQSKPVLTIKLDDHLSGRFEKRYDATISSLGVIEALGGHKLLAVYCNEVIVIELYHPDEIEYGKLKSPATSVQYLNMSEDEVPKTVPLTPSSRSSPVDFPQPETLI